MLCQPRCSQDMSEQPHVPSAKTGRESIAGHETGHDVEFHASDAALIASVADFLAEGVRGGQPIVVIATAAHRNAIATRLRAQGIDIDDLVEGRDRIWLDAEQTLSAFMDGDVPSRELFLATVGNVFDRLKRSREHVVVRAYGEMVDILWRSGKAAAALELERLWNEVADRHAFWLLCAYAHESIAGDVSHPRMHSLCTHHRKATVKDADLRKRFPRELQALLGGCS
jgi:hypothetical protein